MMTLPGHSLDITMVLEASREIMNSLTFIKGTYITYKVWKAVQEQKQEKEQRIVLHGVPSASLFQGCAEKSLEFDTHLTLATNYVPLGKFLFFSLYEKLG